MYLLTDKKLVDVMERLDAAGTVARLQKGKNSEQNKNSPDVSAHEPEAG